MDIEAIREFCLSLRGATEDVKWDNDLCFSVGGKMFCVASLDGSFKATFKAADDEFDELCSTDGISVAEYVGRYKWITVSVPARFSDQEWRTRIAGSYERISEKLPKRIRNGL